MTTEYKTRLPLRTLEDAEPRAKIRLEAVKSKAGFIPNLYAAMANEPGVLATYVSGYDAFRNDAGFTRPEQDVVMLAISRENRCAYCVSAHSQVADTVSKVPVEVIDAIRGGTEIPDPKLAALAAFTKAMLDRRGMPTNKNVDEFLAAGFSERQVLSVVLAIAVATLSNYINHIFHTPIDPMFAPRTWEDPSAVNEI